MVRLWANTSAITQFLPADIAALRRARTRASASSWRSRTARDVVLAVLDGRADLGIFADRTPALGLQILDYRRDRLVLVVPHGHALAAAQAIALRGGAGLRLRQPVRRHLAGAAAAGGDARRWASALKLRIHVRSFDAMCQMVAAGLGIAVLPDAAVQPHLRSMGLRKIDAARRLGRAASC